MTMPATDGIQALTEKEKQTLRMIVRGHDAKSIARSLGLSVHTINERLRDVRRKMAVSSSREAARILFEIEAADAVSPNPDNSGAKRFGEDIRRPAVDQDGAPIDGARRAARLPLMITGVSLMTIVLGLLALTVSPQVATNALPSPTISADAPDAEVVNAAREWLLLIDEGRWADSYKATGSAFRKLNTAQVWASVSEKVRRPLGAVTSRSFVSQENLPAPPAGYEVVKFRTSFANKPDAVETVTLDRENGGWHVVGVTIG